MGLFSTKYKILPATVVTPLISFYQDPIPALIIGTVIGEGDMGAAFTEFRENSLATKAGAFYRYGRDRYTRGLPVGNLRNTNINRQGIKDLIESEIGEEIELLRILYDNSFEDHYVAMHLQDIREMDYYTKIISVNPSGASGELHYTSHEYSAVNSQITIQYTAADNITLVNEVITFTYADNKAYQVLYQILGTAGVGVSPIHWMYIEETLVTGDSVLFPEDPLIPLDNNNYFPVVPFYEDKEAFVDPSKIGTELYTTSKRLLKKFGLSYEDLGDSLSGGLADSIGSGKGMYAYLQLAVELTGGARMVTGVDVPPDGNPIPLSEFDIPVVISITKRYQPSLNYLSEFFITEQGNSKYSKNDFTRSCLTDTYKQGPKLNTILITDGDFNYSLSYYYIDFKVKTGVLTDGKLGVYTSEVHQGITHVNTLLENIKINTSKLYIRKQLTATTYTEVEVCGLVQEIKVFNDKSVTTYLDDAFKGTKYYMTLPLNYEVFKDVPMKYKNALISDSLCFVFNSYTTQEIKWYAQGVFKAIITIISIVLSPFTGGASLTLLMLLRYIVFMIIFNLVMKHFIAPIFRYIAKALGADAAAILAVVLAIVGAMTNNPQAAQLMLSLSRCVFAGVDLQIKMEMEDLQADYAKLKSESEALNDELKRAEGLLDREMNLDPMMMVNAPSSVVWGEEADQFIISRLQVPSVSLALIQLPGIFVDLMLRLPTVNETLNIR